MKRNKEKLERDFEKKLSELYDLYWYKSRIQTKVHKYFKAPYCSTIKIALHFIIFNIKSLFRFFIVKRSSFTDGKIHILLKPAGGIGDHFHFQKYLNFLRKKFKNAVTVDIFLKKSDVFLKDLLYEQNSDVDFVYDRKYPKHDVEMSVVRFPSIEFVDLKRLMALNNKELIDYLVSLLKFKLENDELYFSDYLGRCYSLLHERKRENQPDVYDLLGMSKIKDFRVHMDDRMNSEVLEKYDLQKDSFIVIQTGAGLSFQDFKMDMRQWPIDYYNQLVLLLKKKYPNIKIIQCGVSGQSVIKNVDVDLLGKTSFEELLFLLRDARLLISQEGGYPIIRHYISGKKSCVLFGPTDLNFFGFSENINICAGICPGCEWIDKNWYKLCSKTGKEPKCMASITPQMVMSMIEQKGDFCER